MSFLQRRGSSVLMCGVDSSYFPQTKTLSVIYWIISHSHLIYMYIYIFCSCIDVAGRVMPRFLVRVLASCSLVCAQLMESAWLWGVTVDPRQLLLVHGPQTHFFGHKLNRDTSASKEKGNMKELTSCECVRNYSHWTEKQTMKSVIRKKQSAVSETSWSHESSVSSSTGPFPSNTVKKKSELKSRLIEVYISAVGADTFL